MCGKKSTFITLHVTTIIMYNFTLAWKKMKTFFQHNLLLQIFLTPWHGKVKKKAFSAEKESQFERSLKKIYVCYTSMLYVHYLI